MPRVTVWAPEVQPEPHPFADMDSMHVYTNRHNLCVCVCGVDSRERTPYRSVVWPQAVLTITDLFCEGQLTLNYQLELCSNYPN